MNKLIVDTANDVLMIALQAGDKIFSMTGETKSRHNESMLPLIDKLLNEHGLEIKDVNELGVVVGPGSFTGIRVGIATIKAFRDVLKIDAKGINNLDYLFAIAHGLNKDVKVVAIKGSRDSYFVARQVNGEIYKYERNLTLDELKAISLDAPIGMFGDDENVNCFKVEPDADVLLQVFDKSTDDKLIPVYYQLSQAENEKLKKGIVEIAEAKIQDLNDIERIEKSSILNNPLSHDDIKSIIENEIYKTFVLRFNGELVGFIILQITDEINIISVAVDSNYRNLGLATKLINQSFEFASEKGISQISLEVSDKNITAYLLYEKFGFKTRRIRKKYYADGTDAIEMVKEVKKI